MMIYDESLTTKEVIGLLRLFVITMSLVFVVACSSTDQIDQREADLIGYVMEKTDHGMLVISKEPQDFSETGGVSEFYEATWLSNVPDHIEIGELVSVWYEGSVAESYPGQAKLGKVDVIQADILKGADLSAAEVIRAALKINGQTAAVRSIHYEHEDDQWEIVFKDLMSEDVFTIQVEDY